MGRVCFRTVTLLILIKVILAERISEENESLIVELPHGKLRGRDNHYYYSYESIPYAEPPIGELRFESPKPYAQQWETVFDATRPPVKCQQLFFDGSLVGQEDCLTMNIYKLKFVNKTSRLPVFVHIHGGGFMFGSTYHVSETILMRSGRFIVAKFTYRVGPLGFLSTEDEFLPGNYGLKDQRLALQWIKQNIGSFGGDAENILVTGFSAGGASVHYHLLQPNFKSIAKAAVSFSGTALSPWALVRNARKRAFKMAQNLKCSKVETSLDIKRCLKSKSAEDVVRDVNSFLVFGYNPFTTFGPVVEPASVPDAFLTQLPEEVIKSGNFTPVPWLVTYVAEDGAYNAAELLKKTPQGGELIGIFNEHWYELAPYVLFFKDNVKRGEDRDDLSWFLKYRYLGNKNFSFATYFDLQRMYTDVLYKHGVQRSVELHRNFHGPIYTYLYDNPSDENLMMVIANRTDIALGTAHGDDLDLIMPSNSSVKLRRDQLLISKKFIKMLEGFALYDGKLIYDNCKFVDNVGQKELALMFITKNHCKNKNVKDLP